MRDLGLQLHFKDFGRIKLLILFTLLTFFCLDGFAAIGDGLKGPEWTFTSRLIIHGQNGQVDVEVSRALRDWARIIKQKCPDCLIDRPEGMLWQTVTLPNGYWFRMFQEAGCIEVNAKPTSTNEFRQIKAQVQSLVFDSAREAGLKPHRRVGGGHIHLDVESHFHGNDLLRRNFAVDTFNHSPMYLGALSLDILNAPPMSLLGSAAHLALQGALAEFDGGRINFEQLKERIRKQVYPLSKVKVELTSTRNPYKYQQLNFEHENTDEYRGLPPQISADHYEDMLHLLDSRIAALEKIKTPIAFVPLDQSNQYTSVQHPRTGVHTYKVTVPQSLIVDSFRDYVEGAGLDWQHYSGWMVRDDLIPPKATEIIEPKTCNWLLATFRKKPKAVSPTLPVGNYPFDSRNED